MSANITTLTDKLGKLDWLLCIVFAACSAVTYLGVAETYAGYAPYFLTASIISGVTAWLQPAKLVQRLLERKMIRKRSAR